MTPAAIDAQSVDGAQSVDSYNIATQQEDGIHRMSGQKTCLADTRKAMIRNLSRTPPHEHREIRKHFYRRMTVNTCQMDDIRSKAEHGTADSQDCLDLLKYIDESIPVDFSVDVLEGVQQAISQHLDGDISSAVDSAVRDYLEMHMTQRDIQAAIEKAVRLK